MPRPVLQLLRDATSGANRRITIVLLTSAFCLSAWHAVGNYAFWSGQAPPAATRNELPVAPAIWSLACTTVFLGLVPLFIVKAVLRERLADYGVGWGDLRFAFLTTLLAAPLVIAIGYGTAQMPAFQAVYPINPAACRSDATLTWHLIGQLFWYAAWEFHFRGFLQHGISTSHHPSPALGICVQTLASTLAHFGRPSAEVFASVLAGLIWGALAWRTRSLLAGYLQHWLLGASLDFFICRGT